MIFMLMNSKTYKEEFFHREVLIFFRLFSDFRAVSVFH